MKVLAAAILSLSLVAGLAGAGATPVAAQDGYTVKKKKKKYPRYRAYRTYNEDGSYYTTYYPRLADRLPIGTSRWWYQMDTEQRGGRR